MNHLIFIPAFYFIFVTTIICLIHTFVPEYPIEKSNKFRARTYQGRSRAKAFRHKQPH